MPFRSVIEPETISMLTGILDRHCAKFGIRSYEGREFNSLLYYDALPAWDK